MLEVLFFVLEDSWRALQCQAGKYRKYVQLPLKYQNDDAIRPGNLGEREKKVTLCVCQLAANATEKPSLS